VFVCATVRVVCAFLPAVRLGVLMLADRVAVRTRNALLDRAVMKCGAAATFG
jgi:hypothetical protein